MILRSLFDIGFVVGLPIFEGTCCQLLEHSFFEELLPGVLHSHNINGNVKFLSSGYRGTLCQKVEEPSSPFRGNQ